MEGIVQVKLLVDLLETSTKTCFDGKSNDKMRSKNSKTLAVVQILSIRYDNLYFLDESMEFIKLKKLSKLFL